MIPKWAKINRNIFFLLACCLISSRLVAQLKEKDSVSRHLRELGNPFIKNYVPDSHGSPPQNFDMVRDEEGILYVCNNDGVLIYDGVSWELISLPKRNRAFSLTLGQNGKIFVGADQELGYLEPDSIGKLKYVSLLEHLDPKFQDFNHIWRIHATADGIYFKTDDALLRWDGKNFKGWEVNGDRIWRSFLVNDQIYIQVLRPGGGLLLLKDDKLETIANGERFVNDPIYFILPLAHNRMLLGSNKSNLLIYNNGLVTHFSTEVDPFFSENMIYDGMVLNDSTFAIATASDGMVIIDQEGKRRLKLNAVNLNSPIIYRLYQDRSGLIWAATSHGVSKIEYPSPFSNFMEVTEQMGQGTTAIRFKNKTYMGTGSGLSYLNKHGGEGNPSFTKVGNYQYRVRYMFIFKQELFVLGDVGFYRLKGNDLELIYKCIPTSILQSKLNPSRLFIGTNEGIKSLYYNNGTWEEEDSKMKDVKAGIFFIEEMENGNLWLGTNISEVWQVSFQNEPKSHVLENLKIERFDAENKHPDDVFRPRFINDNIYFISVSTKELYLFDYVSKEFILDNHLAKELGVINEKFFIKTVDENKNIWFSNSMESQTDKQQVAWRQSDNSYKVQDLKEYRIADISARMLFYDEEDKIIWYGGQKGTFRHDLNMDYKIPTIYKAMVRKVIYRNDSLVFSGYGIPNTCEFPFKNNELRFQYTCPSFYQEEKNQFQYKLEGFDEDWSSWTSETKKNYTNIPEGDYRFRVRAKNIFNEISEEDSYAFTILPPWYRTWWIYLIYAFGAIGMVAIISQWRSKELQRKNKNLEGVVKERTVEIQHKNELLNHQTEKLVELNTAKTQLYTNITHEFRTPLTVILGMADALKSDVEKEKFQKAEQSLEMIERNGKKLLRLVNEMLDIAKLESGNMELNMLQTDVIPFVKYLSESFHSLAEDKGINLTVYSEQDELEMDFDANKLTAIITNLIANAVKFTPKNGKIIVHLNKMTKNDGELLVVKVRDNGSGISEEELAHVFDRFYQADTATAKQGQGTGIGLAIAKELVELMKGTIKVESSLSKGSVFTVKIPITRNAIQKTHTKISIAQPVEVPSGISEMKESVEVVNSELPLVLIIEDNEDVAHYLKTCLQGKYQTIHAINGKVGIDMAYEKIPDIVITDVMMPEKDGYEVCEVLKSDERTDHIPIIILTAKVTDKDRLAGLSRGADAYLAKPFQKAELFTRLDQLILLRKKMIGKMERGDFTQLLEKKVDNPETKFIQKVVKFIHEELSNEDLGAIHLARNLYLSESQVYRKLKAITGKSTALFIRSVRLQKAKELILATDKTISEIAYEVGFNDPSWFSRTFKEEFGITPNAIRN